MSLKEQLRDDLAERNRARQAPAVAAPAPAPAEAALAVRAEDPPPNPVLALRGGGTKLWGEFPFHEAAFAGGSHSLRGFQRAAARHPVGEGDQRDDAEAGDRLTQRQKHKQRNDC